MTISADSDDGRAKNATLTEAGQQHLDTIAPHTAGLADALSTVVDSLCQHPEFLNPSG